MPQVCTVCTHADRSAINAALVSGEPKRAIASRYDLTAASVKRHARRHLPRALALATQAARVADADNLIERVQAMERRARAYEAQAASAGNVRVALLALREQRAAAELLGRVTGELREHIDLDVEQREYVATWGTPDGTGFVADHQGAKLNAPALPLVEKNGSGRGP